MINKKPIGVFDSGLGGLSVVEKILVQIPNAKIVYLGDTARVPYGGRTAEELINFADEITQFLVDKGCGVIVDACNSTSAVALEFLKEKYPNPIIGVIEPGIKSAVNTTKNGRIGLIATEATVKSGAYKKAAGELDKNIRIFSLACPEFVPLVEAGKVSGERVISIVEKNLQPLLDTKIDTLILGCTHYPYLAALIKSVVGNNIELVDPAYETTKETKRFFISCNEEISIAMPVEHEYFVTGDPGQFQKVGEILMGRKLPLVKKVITCEK